MRGPAPYGTKWSDGHLVADLTEVPVVRELVEAFVASGGRMKAVAAALNAKGHRTRRGPWSDTAVNRVLRNAALRDLIPKDLWGRCEGLLAGRMAGSDSPARRPAHPLGVVVECRSCGGRMHLRGHGPAGKFVCRGCRATIAADTLDRLFVKSLASVEIAPNEIVAALAGNPRAAEVTRMIGGKAVALSEVWPELDPSRRQQLVDLLVARIVVGSDEISVVFSENDDSEGNTHSSTANSLPTSHGSEPVAPDEASPERRPPPRLEDLPELLSVGEVAEVLRLSKSKLYELIASRQLPAHRPGGRLRITAKAVREFLRDSRLERNPVR